MYKVRCKLVKFEGDPETFPCHFRYEIGDEIYYDGMQLTGKICPHIILPMMPVIYGLHTLGQNFCKNMPFRYRGMDVRDPSMAKYDGEGWRPRTEFPPQVMAAQTTVFPVQSKTDKARGAHFLCPDSRTLAHFTADAYDISDSEFCQPFYRRAVAILEKIEAEPGIATGDILGRFNEFEREKISPPLTPVFIDVLLETLADMGYVELKEGQALPTGKEPPSRPKIG